MFYGVFAQIFLSTVGRVSGGQIFSGGRALPWRTQNTEYQKAQMPISKKSARALVEAVDIDFKYQALNASEKEEVDELFMKLEARRKKRRLAMNDDDPLYEIIPDDGKSASNCPKCTGTNLARCKCQQGDLHCSDCGVNYHICTKSGRIFIKHVSGGAHITCPLC